ncbi:hypothetical protein KUTeg_013514 [Tegillarca granosa]|uniref:Golgin-84 n=1 Tax=Tegillarca granosa TaxID=220873 RepID=A0ABQ9EZ19_TEGGR|nr:hypothetical protein KUTeg_013514 [Tegillarca granosa]
MSWLSGITGKAEDFLNKLDNSAAQALNVSKSESESYTGTITGSIADHSSYKSTYSSHTGISGKSHSLPVSAKSNVGDPTSSFVSTPIKQKNVKSQVKATTTGTPGGSVQSQKSSLTPDVTTTKSSKNKLDTDEALFEFLNSSEPVDNSKVKTTPGNSARHSRQSSTSSNVSAKGTNIKHVEPAISATSTADNSPPSTNSGSGSSMVHVEMPGSGSDRGSPSNSDLGGADIDALTEALLEQSSTNSVHSNQDNDTHTTGETQQKLSSLELENKLLKNEVASLNQEMASVIQRAKDSQSELNAVKKKLEDYNRHSSKNEQMIREFQSRENDLLETLTAKDSQLAVLRIRLEEADKTVEQKQKNINQLEEARNRILKDHNDSSGLHGQALDAMKEKLIEVENALKREQEAYKIAQSKERLIASLREGSGSSTDTAGVSNLEFDSVKQERDMLREELQQSKMSVENLRVDLQDLETQLQQESDSAHDHIRSLEESVNDEKQRREDSEQELLKQKQELQYSIEEMHKQKTAFQNCLKDRETEIEKLRNQLTHKSLNSTTESELESRVRSLTESLIQKQTMLESLSTEKNSLTLQLERLGQQYKDVQASSLRTNTAVVNVNEDDDVRQRLPTFMRETPTDTEVTKKIKKAANSIDKFSIRLGVFLRRYPMARVFIILYMVVLHLWVMVVLLTYQPEMHGADFLPKAPGHSEGQGN